MLTLKQADGSFVMHVGGEVDVRLVERLFIPLKAAANLELCRGCYCGLTVAVLLNILTPDLARGTFDFIARYVSMVSTYVSKRCV